MTARTRSHLVGELREMINHVAPAEMTNAELASAIAVFHPIHDRVIPVPTGARPVLRIVRTLSDPDGKIEP